MSDRTSDIDWLLDRLIESIRLLREQNGETNEIDDMETRLFEAHDAVMTDYAKIRMNGGQVLSHTKSIDDFNIIRYEILVALQELYLKLQLSVIDLKKKMNDQDTIGDDSK